MHLEIVVGGVTLWKKAAGREEDNSFFCNSFHVFHQLKPVVFGEVFDDIQ